MAFQTLSPCTQALHADDDVGLLGRELRLRGIEDHDILLFHAREKFHDHHADESPGQGRPDDQRHVEEEDLPYTLLVRRIIPLRCPSPLRAVELPPIGSQSPGSAAHTGSIARGFVQRDCRIADR